MESFAKPFGLLCAALKRSVSCKGITPYTQRYGIWGENVSHGFFRPIGAIQ
jgi:hypothetical protein